MSTYLDEIAELLLEALECPVPSQPPVRVVTPRRPRATKRKPKRVFDSGGGRPRKHPSAVAIASAQVEVWSKKIGLDDPLNQCWFCLKTSCEHAPVKAHIHPVRSGGTDAPNNFFLLCASCHDLVQDDTTTRVAQIEWLLSPDPWRAIAARFT